MAAANSGQNEGIRVLGEFVCNAIPVAVPAQTTPPKKPVEIEQGDETSEPSPDAGTSPPSSTRE